MLFKWVVTYGDEHLAVTTVVETVDALETGFFITFSMDYSYTVVTFSSWLTNLDIF